MKTFPSIVNQFLVYLQLNEVKGKYRFYQLTHRLFKQFVIQHQVANRPFYVPYDQWCFWKNYGPNNYYLDEMLPFTDFLNKELSDFDFIDLGADIGTVSAIVRQYCQQLNRIVAVEPNPSSFKVLTNNFLPPECTYNFAISDFNGRCKFSFDMDAASDHEGHIKPKEQGETQVFTLDKLVESNKLILAKELAIKIDVEGQEQAVFRGAKVTIQDAHKVVILLELHPDTLHRDGLTAEKIFDEAELLRNFDWFVPLCSNKEVNRSKPFFEQFSLQQYDVIGVSNTSL